MNRLRGKGDEGDERTRRMKGKGDEGTMVMREVRRQKE